MPQPLENLPSYEELGPIDLTFLDSPAATSESEFSFATNEGSSDDSSEDAPLSRRKPRPRDDGSNHRGRSQVKEAREEKKRPPEREVPRYGISNHEEYVLSDRTIIKGKQGVTFAGYRYPPGRMRTEVAKPNPSTERPGTATLILTKSSAPPPEVMNADDNGSSAEGGTKPTADPEHLAPAPAPKLMTIDEPTSPVASRSPQPPTVPPRRMYGKRAVGTRRKKRPYQTRHEEERGSEAAEQAK